MRKHPANWLPVLQNTAEWLDARIGCVTASRVGDVVAVLKNGNSSAKYHTYQMEILTEILTGKGTEHYVSPYMDFGTEYEPIARAAYEMEKGIEVERVGFVLHPRIPRSGASPDGCVGEEGLIEIKVPAQTTHLEYLLEGVVPDDYKPQMLWQMACTERQWCDFVSYDPRMPQEFGLFVARFERDEKAITEMEARVEKFLAEVNAMSEKLLEKLGPITAPVPVMRGAGPVRAIIP